MELNDIQPLFGHWPNSDGSGDGYGSGYGSGSGSGDGYGYGSGDGYGSGSGYGYGYGSKEYWLACLDGFASQWSETQRARLQTLRDQGITIAYWCSDKTGKPCNGGRGKAVSPGHVDEEKGPLKLCERGTLHATHIPPQWSGDRWWIVALHGEVIGDAEKFGALKREIIGEATLPDSP